ncbi:chemotaxis protein [Pseudohoeflea suaedae]|uniref:Chemotaxis protein n=1 Tax=Pseudohoeflea suaedae TaxID=877384 RepID=A0A4V3A7C3_9HYPH|nr:chemotaxis protein [Pseudohoeflea suaedae]TDH38275.1 chemotaxis protein [Pseudohoeflea suaedae]
MLGARLARLSAATAIVAVFAVFGPPTARAASSSHGEDVVADVLAQGGEHSGDKHPALAEGAGSGGGQHAEAETGHADGEDAEKAAEVEAPDPDPQDLTQQQAIDNYIRSITPEASGANRTSAELQPYQLIRSLQYVQDSVVQGDHAAMEMQRYLLGVIDERLRKADQSVFDNPRNVDAALVYAMSGGNPDTLDLLAAKDRFGHFDNEVTTVLRAYLDGMTVRTQTSLDELLDIYAGTRIAAYLALIAANVKAGLNEEGSLEIFDRARLEAPGTIIEEAALRRSLFVAAKKGRIDAAVHYASLYARRFINSPYAGQYADQLVELGTDHIDVLGTDQLQRILAFMDARRQREVYLRISRKAAINGQADLALLAAEKAKELSDPSDPAPAALAGLYSGLASVPSEQVVEVDRSLDELVDMPLSSRDAALRDAARLIANEIIREPDPNSLTQAFSPSIEGQTEGETMSAGPAADDPLAGMPDDGSQPPEGEQLPTDTAAAAGAVDDEFRSYLEGQNKLIDEIDSLLAGNDGVDKP